jgi:hypothetical protein
MPKKSKSNIKDIIEETGLSGPAPDDGLTVIGSDMYWKPEHFFKKEELVENKDNLVDIL